MTVEAAARDPRVQALPSRSDYHIGAYLGVPVMLTPTQLYGTLCVLDPDPHRFHGHDLDLLVILSSWLRMSLDERVPMERTVDHA